MHRAIKLCGVGLLLLCASCPDSEGLALHSCSEEFHDPSDWSRYNVGLLHHEPRRCPLSISEPNSLVYAAGDIVDHGNRDFASSYVNVKAGGWDNREVGGDVAYFEYDPYGSWTAQHRLFYYAASDVDIVGQHNPDQIRYSLGPVPGP